MQILIPWVECTNLEKLAETANKICKNAGMQNVNAIPNLPNSQVDQIQQLQSNIHKLTEQVKAMSVTFGQHILNCHWQHSNWNRCSNRHHSKIHTRNTGICCYHHKFGTNVKVQKTLCICATKTGKYLFRPVMTTSVQIFEEKLSILYLWLMSQIWIFCQYKCQN